MTSTHTSGSSRRILGSFLVLSICAAALATTAAAPAAASANLAVTQPNEWHINDAPDLHGGSWWGGKPAEDVDSQGQRYGYGPARHNGSSYAYVSEDTGDPADHWARWDMGTREGTQQLAVFVPRADASARVRYRITIGSRSTYTDRITQREIYGWHSLGTVTTNGDRVRIEVHYNDSQTAPGLSGSAARTVGVDAMAMRCMSNCSEEPPPPPRSVRATPHGEKSLRVTWSPPANTSASSIRGYEVQFSRGALNNHQLHGDRDPWSSSRIPVNGTTHTSGRLLQGVTYKVAVWTVNQNDQRSQSASTTATTEEPDDTVTFNPVSVEQTPLTRTVESDSPSRSSGWIRQDDGCGFFGCNDHYYLSGDSKATASWYMGDLQGVFSFSWKNPKDTVSNLGGHPIWRIYEKRTGSDDWRLVKTFRPRPQSEQRPDRWWGYHSSRIVVDGEVKVEVSHDHDERYGVLGIRRVRLRFDDILPELKAAAIDACKIAVEKRLALTSAVPLSVMAATLIVYAAPAGASYVSTALSRKGLALLVERAATKAGVNFASWAAQKIAGVDDPISGLTLLEGVKDLVVDYAGDIWSDAVDSYQYGCNDFKADWIYLGIARGYGEFADEMAELWGRRRP